MSEAVHGPSGAGSVVLDLGGAMGALVLETSAALSGREIEISLIAHATGAPGGRTHSLVRERRTDGGMVTRFRWPD